MKWNNHYKKKLSLISPIKKRLACSVQSSSYGARGRLLSTKRNSVKSGEHSGQTLRIHEFENNKRDWRKVRKCVRQMKERFLRKIKFWLYFVELSQLRTLGFGDKGKWQNFYSTLAAESAVCCKHRPVIVRNILCGCGSSLFHTFFSVFTGNSIMNTTKNNYSQHGQVYGRLHHAAV